MFSTKINTQIEINATPQKVWNTLTSFEEFPNWNPFIKSITGDLEVGSILEVNLDGMVFNPEVKTVEKYNKFGWMGKLGVSGIFDGHHVFEIIKKNDAKVVFKQYERFSGLLIPIFMLFMKKATIKNFNKMNKALKRECETK